MPQVIVTEEVIVIMALAIGTYFIIIKVGFTTATTKWVVGMLSRIAMGEVIAVVIATKC